MSPEDAAHCLSDDGGDECRNVEVSVHITAPTSAAFDNMYRDRANATLQFRSATRMEVGSISWPPQRTFLVDEGHQKELAMWGTLERDVVVSPVLKRKDCDGSQEGQARLSKPRVLDAECLLSPLTSSLNKDIDKAQLCRLR
jgi:hypothetical protein